MKKQVIIAFALVGIPMALMSIQAKENRIEQVNIMFLLDASTYSAAPWYGNSKFEHIRTALQHVYEEMNKTPIWGLNVGLRVFGDSSVPEKNNCLDYRLAVKLDWFEPGLLNRSIEAVVPKGKNCFAYGIVSVVEDFPTNRPLPRNILISFITARDDCTKDEFITLKNVIDMAQIEAVYIIGVDLEKADQDYFQPFFSELPGLFINATSPESLKETAVDIVIQKSLKKIEPQELVGQETETRQNTQE